MIENIELAQIKPPKNSLRKELGAIEELAASIAEKGLMQPLIVRPIGDFTYEVIAGERRFAALTKLGISSASCSIVKADDKDAFELSLVENIQRKSLDPIEEGEAFKRYVAEFGWGSMDDLAERMGKNKTYVSRSISRIGISPQALELLRQRNISKSHADEIARVPDQPTQDALADTIQTNDFTKDQTRHVVDSVLSGSSVSEAAAEVVKPMTVDEAMAVVEEAGKYAASPEEVTIRNNEMEEPPTKYQTPEQESAATATETETETETDSKSGVEVTEFRCPDCGEKFEVSIDWERRLFAVRKTE